MKETQQSMFSHEDTPLFSGTVQATKPDIFKPRIEEIQDPMFDCPLCHDTGEITTWDYRHVVRRKPCVCKKGAE